MQALDNMLPFDFESKDVEDEYTYYWGCTFKANCGPFKKGERIGLLKLIFNIAFLYEINGGEVLRDTKLKIVGTK